MTRDIIYARFAVSIWIRFGMWIFTQNFISTHKHAHSHFWAVFYLCVCDLKRFLWPLKFTFRWLNFPCMKYWQNRPQTEWGQNKWTTNKTKWTRIQWWSITIVSNYRRIKVEFFLLEAFTLEIQWWTDFFSSVCYHCVGTLTKTLLHRETSLLGINVFEKYAFERWACVGEICLNKFAQSIFNAINSPMRFESVMVMAAMMMMMQHLVQSTRQLLIFWSEWTNE